jgi:hypothetical protein
MWSQRVQYLTEPTEGIQHLYARKQVEWYLRHNGRTVIGSYSVSFKPKFIAEHKLEKRFVGHSYDIVTQSEVIEIDDLQAHTKTAHIINDQIAERYIKEYHPEYKFYRLLKEEIVDTHGRLLDPSDVANYLREHLF